MGARNRDLETGCQVALIALIVVACIAGIPPIIDAVTKAVVQSRIDAAPIRFACRSCGQVEDVHEVTLGAGTRNVSTVTGDGYAMLLGLLTGRLDGEPVKVLEVAVRLQDGSVRVFHERASSPWQPGDRVKVSTGRIRPLS